MSRWRQGAFALSTVVAALMAAASTVGLVVGSLYRDNLLVASGWRGNDLITLLIAVPALATAVARTRRGSARAELAWLGLLDYALYNYLFYLFGAAFNAGFLLYVAIVTAATGALALGLASLDATEIARRFSAAPTRRIAAFLALLAVGLGGFHVTVAGSFLRTGDTPGILVAIGHPTNVIAALDLWLVVSVSALAAWWLWRREPWGLVLAAILTVKGAVYMLALSAATVSAARAGALTDLTQLWLWATLGLGCAGAAAALLTRVQPHGEHERTS